MLRQGSENHIVSRFSSYSLNDVFELSSSIILKIYAETDVALILFASFNVFLSAFFVINPVLINSIRVSSFPSFNKRLEIYVLTRLRYDAIPESFVY